MKVIILAAGQGTRLRPLTDEKPKCMVEINGKSIIKYQIETMNKCGISQNDIYIVCGYCDNALREHLKDFSVNFIYNDLFETTNMVCSFMCAKDIMQNDIIVSYGDIVYNPSVLNQLIECEENINIVVDDGWYDYWASRTEDPLSDAETLKIGTDGLLKEIGQKTNSLSDIESQYIGLMRFKGIGLEAVLNLCKEAKNRTENNLPLWHTERNYQKMYMTDMLQGLIDTGVKLHPLRINRGWFEVDNMDDLKVAENNINW